MEIFSTGILSLPANSTKLVMSFKNNTSSVQKKKFYVFNWDLNEPVLFSVNEYAIGPNESNIIETPLYFSEDIGIIKDFEVVYEPFDQNVTINISTK